MFSSDAYVIRRATPGDASSLLDLSRLDSQRVLTGPALIGEIAGEPAAAISLETGRAVADPFVPTAALVAHLRVRAVTFEPAEPSLRQRLRAGAKFQLTPRYRT
jgi:hypothetical protein